VSSWQSLRGYFWGAQIYEIRSCLDNHRIIWQANQSFIDCCWLSTIGFYNALKQLFAHCEWFPVPRFMKQIIIGFINLTQMYLFSPNSISLIFTNMRAA